MSSPNRPHHNVKTRKKKIILPSLVDPVSSLVSVRYLDTRNILLKPTALPIKAASHTRCNCLVFVIGRMLDQHHAQHMEVVVIVVKNDDDGKDTSLCISTQSQKKIAIRDTARGKSERLKK